ncbi:hypothetical protein IL38_16090 [Actinopolyspora erythraea]|uniref:Secreted protein n=1 Tax=Actinopolyspora erythraea TaxID=414996 RepID=A0ABR4X1Y4_9ACTN|nr:hypothetical protein IL38_16090 [Actinopolyspora erythraea]
MPYMRMSSRCCFVESLGCLPRSFPLALTTAMPSFVLARRRLTSNSVKVARMTPRSLHIRPVFRRYVRV